MFIAIRNLVVFLALTVLPVSLIYISYLKIKLKFYQNENVKYRTKFTILCIVLYFVTLELNINGIMITKSSLFNIIIMPIISFGLILVSQLYLSIKLNKIEEANSK